MYVFSGQIFSGVFYDETGVRCVFRVRCDAKTSFCGPRERRRRVFAPPVVLTVTRRYVQYVRKSGGITCTAPVLGNPYVRILRNIVRVQIRHYYCCCYRVRNWIRRDRARCTSIGRCGGKSVFPFFGDSNRGRTHTRSTGTTRPRFGGGGVDRCLPLRRMGEIVTTAYEIRATHESRHPRCDTRPRVRTTAYKNDATAMTRDRFRDSCRG